MRIYICCCLKLTWIVIYSNILRSQLCGQIVVRGWQSLTLLLLQICFRTMQVTIEQRWTKAWTTSNLVNDLMYLASHAKCKIKKKELIFCFGSLSSNISSQSRFCRKWDSIANISVSHLLNVGHFPLKIKVWMVIFQILLVQKS